MTTGINRKKMFIYVHHAYMWICSVMSNSKGWLELGFYMPNLVEEMKEKKFPMGRTNRFL